MKTLFSKKTIISTIFLLISISILVHGLSTGITGVTKRNGDGCICHSETPNQLVIVTISGPDQLEENETATYSVTIQGGPLTRAGTNIAVSKGIINPASSSGLQKISNELTHTLPKAPSGGVVIFEFEYTAPSEPGYDTLFANGNSVNFNGQNTGDSWNFASNKIVQIGSVVPVELSNFTASVAGKKITLNWSTITEKNNSGFEIQKLFSDAEWFTVGFVKGSGNSLEPQSYSFEEDIHISGKYNYRLKQIDYNGSYSFYELDNEIDINVVKNFNMSQNYPNPFNPSTIIEYELPTDANVKLTIYNSVGEEVKTIVNELVEAGSYKYLFNASGLPSGIYYSKINFSSDDNQNFYTKVTKMLLLK